MTTISARDASRGFASVLDSVEKDGEEYTVVREGKPVARIVPATSHTVSDFLALRSGRESVDEDFAADAVSANHLLLTHLRDPWQD